MKYTIAQYMIKRIFVITFFPICIERLGVLLMSCKCLVVAKDEQ